MGQTISVKYTFEFKDFDLEVLKRKLNESMLIFDSIATFHLDGDLADFTDEFCTALEELEVVGNLYYDPGSSSRWDGGYPPSRGCEDLSIELVEILGKKIDLTDCMTDKCYEKIEDKLFDEWANIK